jgi:hypothetical protein
MQNALDEQKTLLTDIGLGLGPNHDNHGTCDSSSQSAADASQVLVGLLRHYVTVLLNSAPKKQPSIAVREQYVLVPRYLGATALIQ